MNNRLKILYIITKSAWGGATKYTYDLASAMPQNGFETHIAAGPALSREKNLFSELQNSGVYCHTIKNFQKSVNPLKDLFALWEILRLIQKIKPDIVHASSSKAGGLAGLAAFILKILSASRRTKNYPPAGGLKTIFTAHGWAYHESRPRWQRLLIKLSSRITALFYDTIITVSEFDRQSAIKNKIGKPEKFITIHNGINPAGVPFLTRNEARRVLIPARSQEDILVGTIGEFTANKGQKFLIEAAHMLCQRYPKLNFMIIGHRGEEKSKLLRQITKSGLTNCVHIIDSPPDAAKYLKAFDIFVLPSLKEGLPYVLLEAGLAELPTIATNVGGNKEIIDPEKNGLLITPADSQELSRVIERVFKNADLKNAMAKNLYEKILNDFSLKKMISETLAIYRQ
ncbi:MAG: glycosyltransferase family 4 protein [Candidatus Niyogibacteria bacterium]|nr:glycosyltransferase family 4 protein [Candidatus Niyogibacteria bacterium]